jgi:hypothetical protein
MSGATSALYETLIERDLDAIPAAVRTFLETGSEDELFLAIARFAVLAYAPSQHAKHAVLCARAAHELRGEHWVDLLIECARYAAESRQPWSEPPLLEPPEPDPDEDLSMAVAAVDRLRAERWLSAHLDDPALEQELRSIAAGDALLMTDAAFALIPLLGNKGTYALLRMAVWELVTNPSEPVDAPIEELVQRAIDERGSIESVHAVILASTAGFQPAPEERPAGSRRYASTPPIYRLARDYGQTLLAHAIAPRLPRELAGPFLAAVHHNLEHGESFAEWTLA